MNSGRLPKDRWSPLLPAEAPSGNRDYVARTKVWRWNGDGGWHFANLSVKQSAEIKARFGSTARGWGSIRIHVKIGGSEWDTSLFPDRKRKSYLFAIKASVRKAEGIAAGDRITAGIHIV